MTYNCFQHKVYNNLPPLKFYVIILQQILVDNASFGMSLKGNRV